MVGWGGGFVVTAELSADTKAPVTDSVQCQNISPASLQVVKEHSNEAVPSLLCSHYVG